MEQTAIQSGAVPVKPLETGMKSGAPPVDAADAPATEVKMQPPKKHPLREVLEVVADLRITVTLFALAIVLVFWGTLAQVDHGIWTVVKGYFRSPLAWVPLKVVCFNSIEWPGAIPFPGGWLIGGVMFVNLLAAHAIRFKLTWNRVGILVIHAGIIVMMVGELLTGLYAVEGIMVIPVGQGTNIVSHRGDAELAIIKTTDTKSDKVVTVPVRLLKETGAIVDDPQVPFKIEVVHYMVNTNLKFKKGLANRGVGREISALDHPEVNGVDPNQKFDHPSVYLKLTGRDGKDLGIWMFSWHPAIEVQWVDVKGDKKKDSMYQVQFRFKETIRDFTMHLTKFTHDVYPGTTTPKDFHSYVVLTDKAGPREVEIYMNVPLYYAGETFYQSETTADINTGKVNGTVLQVVSNPGWLLPYLSCALVGFGLLGHFGQTLYRFLDRRVVR